MICEPSIDSDQLEQISVFTAHDDITCFLSTLLGAECRILSDWVYSLPWVQFIITCIYFFCMFSEDFPHLPINQIANSLDLDQS